MNAELVQLIQAYFAKAMESETVAGLVAQMDAIYKRFTSTVHVRDKFGMDPVLVQLLRPVFEFLYKDWWRVEIKGIKNIPARGPAIVVANHSGMLPYDAAMINMGIYSEHPKHRNVRFLVADFIGNFPVLSRFIERAGGVKASPENAKALVKKGEIVCVFPEGTRGIGKLYADRYKLQDFGKGGVVRVAMETGVPVIPCAVIGAEDIHPILYKFDDIGRKFGLPFLPVTPTFPLFGLVGLIPFPSKWTIKFGRPIRYKKCKKSNILHLTEDLRMSVQSLIDSEISPEHRR
jgi:1-acyl-sn-glycerol-3-phosphate acyltransferase